MFLRNLKLQNKPLTRGAIPAFVVLAPQNLFFTFYSFRHALHGIATAVTENASSFYIITSVLQLKMSTEARLKDMT